MWKFILPQPERVQLSVLDFSRVLFRAERLRGMQKKDLDEDLLF